MEEFKETLRVRRVTVLSGLRHKMDVLRTENQFLKELLQMHNIECPPLEEITSTPLEMSDEHVPVNLDDTPDEPAITDDVETSAKSCEKCESLESEIVRLKKELSETQNDLQEANGQILSQTQEMQKISNHCQALKDVNRIIKELIGIRDQELTQLKEKFKEIEKSMSERETEIMSENLRTEYTRQLENIRRLKTLYEQRARSADAEIEILKRKLTDKSAEVDNELLKNQTKEERITLLEEEVTQLKADLSSTRDVLKDSKNEMELLQNDLRAINMLFTRILTNKDNFDLDRLKNVLEENRMLLTEVTTRSNDCSIIADSVLPKLLCDLIVGAFADPELGPIDSCDLDQSQLIIKPDLLPTEEIIENLPKIWRILTELLIHQKTTQLTFDANGKSEDCYKTVDTPTGPQLVLSVSKTFIKLKDLIMEKKGLQKETKRLKVLNQHLQQTLNSQEDRLGAVSVEVTKTWHLVNRMQRQHRQLHTKEQVLRYHLQQKRRMLNVLKEELETCRHKWTKAREKNESTEIQWKLLRDEFTSRKEKSQSVESGYSDDHGTDDDADVEDNVAAGEGSAQAAAPVIEVVDPIDETLEEMFYRLNAIHTANSINFEPLREDHQRTTRNYTVSISSTDTEREHAFENNRSTEVFNELPPDLIDETTTVAVVAVLEGIPENVAEDNRPTSVSVDPEPGTSSGTTADAPTDGLTSTEEEYTARRNERIKRLEEQCKALFDKMTSNKKKGDDLSEQLDTIHTRQLERGNSSAQNNIPEGSGGELAATNEGVSNENEGVSTDPLPGNNPQGSEEVENRTDSEEASQERRPAEADETGDGQENSDQPS